MADEQQPAPGTVEPPLVPERPVDQPGDDRETPDRQKKYDGGRIPRRSEQG